MGGCKREELEMSGIEKVERRTVQIDQKTTGIAYLGVAMIRGATISRGYGAWGAVINLVGPGEALEEVPISGLIGLTTPNRAWLVAAAAAMDAIKGRLTGSPPKLFSTSEYLVQNATPVRHVNWHTNGWLKWNGEPVLNADEWKRLHGLRLETSATFHTPSTATEIARCADAKGLAEKALMPAREEGTAV